MLSTRCSGVNSTQKSYVNSYIPSWDRS